MEKYELEIDAFSRISSSPLSSGSYRAYNKTIIAASKDEAIRQAKEISKEEALSGGPASRHVRALLHRDTGEKTLGIFRKRALVANVSCENRRRVETIRHEPRFEWAHSN